MLNYIKNSPEVIMYKSFSLRCMISFLVCVGVACVEAKCPVPGTIPDVNKIKIPVIERHSPVKSKELKLTVDGGNIGGVRKNWPVRFAVPIPRGELKSAENISLKTAEGKPVSVCGKPTCYWPEGEVKWLLLEFLSNIPESGQAGYVLTYGTDVKPLKSSNLKVEEGKDSISVSTGAISFSVGKKAEFLSDIKKGATAVTPKGKGLGCFLNYSLSSVVSPEAMSADTRMNVLLSESEPSKEILGADFSVDSVKVVEKNTIQVTVAVEGNFKTKTVIHPVKMFITAYADSPLVKINHSLIYAGYSIKDHIRSYGLDLPLAGSEGKSKMSFGMEDGKPVEGISFVQKDDQNYILDSKPAAGRSEGWAKTGNVAAAVKDLWKTYPVAFSVAGANNDLRLKTALFGPEEGAFLDLRYRTGDISAELSALRPCTKGAPGYFVSKLTGNYDGDGSCDARGIQKTHTVIYNFDVTKEGSPDTGTFGKATDKMPLIFCDPEYFASTGVYGIFPSYEAAPEFQNIKNAASVVFDWAFVTRDVNRWYGFIDFGDINASANKPEGDTLPHIFSGGVGWCSGNHYGQAFLSHAFMTNTRKYFDFASTFLQHKVDIDFEHIGGGKIEQTDYGVFTRHNQVHWRGGGEPRQAPITDIIYYYWATGDLVIGDGLKMAIDWINKPAYGRSAILDKSKINISCKCGPMNWPAFLMWETTGDPKYIWFVKPFAKALEELLDAGIGVNYGAGSVDIGTDGKLNISKYGEGGLPTSYFLTYDAYCPLIEYANLTGDKDVVRALLKTAYVLKNANALDFRQYYDTADWFLDYVYGLTGDRAFYNSLEQYRFNKFAKFKGIPKESYTVQSLIDTMGGVRYGLFVPDTNNMGLVITALKPIRFAMHGYLTGKRYPTAVAGKDVVVSVMSGKDYAGVKLDGTKSTVTGANIVEYEWTEEEKGKVKVLSNKAADTIQFKEGLHSVMLRIKDSNGIEAAEKIQITVNPGGVFKFNFAPANVESPLGYIVSNEVYSETAGFGWENKVTVTRGSGYMRPLDNNTVAVPNKTRNAFKIKTSDGLYRVSLGVGHVWGESGNQHLEFEGGKKKIDLTLEKNTTVSFVDIPVEVKGGEFKMEVGGKGEGTTHVAYLCLVQNDKPLEEIKFDSEMIDIKSDFTLARIAPGVDGKLPKPFSPGLKLWKESVKLLKIPVIASGQLPTIETDLAEIPPNSKREISIDVDAKKVPSYYNRVWIDLGVCALKGTTGPVSIIVEGKEVFRSEGLPEKTIMRIRNIGYDLNSMKNNVTFSVSNGDASKSIGVGFIRVDVSSGALYIRKFIW